MGRMLFEIRVLWWLYTFVVCGLFWGMYAVFVCGNELAQIQKT